MVEQRADCNPSTRPMRICQARLSFAFFMSLPFVVVVKDANRKRVPEPKA
jgi:hypothetical protein